MLTAAQLAQLSWDPLRDTPRVENYALSVEGYRGSQSLFYILACGHRSLAGSTICERGCLTAPAWRKRF